MNNKNSMHPQDKKNLIVFFIACVGLFIIYDLFIYKPHINAVRAQQAAQKAATPVAPNVTATAAPDAQTDAPLPIAEAVKDSPRITIESETVKGSLSLKGARFDDLALLRYAESTTDSTPVPLLAPTRSHHPQFAEFGWVASDTSVRMPSRESLWRVVSANRTLAPNTPVTLEWANGENLIFRRTVTLDNNYMFDIKDEVINTGNSPVTLFPYAHISRLGLPKIVTANAIMHEGPVAYLDGTLHEAGFYSLAKDDDDAVDTKAVQGWIGLSEKYWLTALVPLHEKGEGRYRISTDRSGKAPRYQTDFTGAGITIAAGEASSHDIRFFAGPKLLNMLEQYEEDLKIQHFDLAIDFGIFYFMTRPFFIILTWIGHSTGSFAFAILAFTVLLRLCVFPLANKSFRSFARMRKLNPQMIEMREKYGADREKLQKAIFELYQKENVNPMAGCLPILIQIPIFFALYKVLYISLDMRHTPFWGWIDDMSAMDPTTLFNLFGLLSWTPPSFLMIGAWPCIMCVTLLLQHRLNPPAQDPIQAKMMLFMPFFITLILAKFPAGLVIYWSWGNLLSMVQQYVLLRKEGVTVTFFHRTPAEQKLEDLVEHGPKGVSPAAEMIEEEIEDLIEGNEHDAAAQDGKKDAEKPVKALSKPKTTKKKTAAKSSGAKSSTKGKSSPKKK